MTDLVARAGRRTWQRHPWLVALAVVGVALGVALVVGVDLANQSARSAFQRSVAVLSGPVTHRIEAAAGGLDQDWYADLRIRESALRMAPVVTGNVLVPSRRGTRADSASWSMADATRMRLLGVDPLAEQSIRPAFGLVGLGGGGGDGAGADIGDLILADSAPWPVVVTRATAHRRGWQSGDRVPAAVDGIRTSIRIAAVLAPADAATRTALDDLLLADIGVAQLLSDRAGMIDRIDLALPTQHTDRTVERLRTQLPQGVVLVSTRGEDDVLDQLAGAFRLNLQALGMLSLLVGMVLIIGMINVLAVQRRETFGLMRAIGVPGRRLVADILWEAAALGAVGGLLGIALGILIAQPLTWAVTATIDDLYTRVSVRSVRIDTGMLAGVWLLAVAVAVVGAVPAASEVARSTAHAIRSRSQGERRAWRGAVLAAACGVPVALLGALVLMSTSGMIAGWVGTVACILAALCLVPLMLVAVVSALRGRRRASPLIGVVLGGITRHLSRTGLAATALVLALGTGIGVGLMVSSFRTTVQDWLQATLGADIYIGVARQRPSDPPAHLPEGVLLRVQEQVPQVALITSAVADLPVGAAAGTLTSAADERLRVVALGMDAETPYTLPLVAGPADLWSTLHQGGCAITEVLATKRGLTLGDTLVLDGVSLPIRGVIRDFTPDQGRVYLHRRVFAQYWSAPPVAGIALLLPPEAEVDAVASDLRAALSDYAVDVQPARALRALSLRIFDRTFRVTGILQILTTAIAALAVATTALALRLERRGEMALLRAHGADRRLVGRLQRGSLVVLGAVSGLLAIPVGYGMAWLLAGVINRRSFGWALVVEWSFMPVLTALVLAIVAAWIASLAPGGGGDRALVRDLQEDA